MTPEEAIQNLMLTVSSILDDADKCGKRREIFWKLNRLLCHWEAELKHCHDISELYKAIQPGEDWSKEAKQLHEFCCSPSRLFESRSVDWLESTFFPEPRRGGRKATVDK